ncbi:MAG: class I SAM-dependent methyltransferase [Chloroflexi bacterium]|nr:class I SAM-dependent methyltransferase [Chloroflexota bacterium]
MTDQSRESKYRSPTDLHNQGWEGQGFNWEHPWTPKKKRLALESLKELGQPETVRILDYGCGDAVMVQAFHDAGYQVEGTDISEVVINSNKEKLPHLNFKLTSPDSLAPYSDGSFDAIFCSEVIEHLYDVNFVFSDFNRLLRPGGQLMLTTPYHGLVKNLIIALFFFEAHYRPTWQHIRFFTKKSLTQVCLDHQFTPKKWGREGRIGPLARSFFLTCQKTG